MHLFGPLHRIPAALAVAALWTASLGAQAQAQDLPKNEIPKSVHKNLLTADALRGLAGFGTATANGIFYHGGPVMLGNANVYLIWYGIWTPAAQSILTNLVTNVGGSPYLRTNATYFDASGRYVTGNSLFSGQTNDAYSQGKSLSDDQIQTIVSNAIQPTGTLPLDPNGVYFVLTAPDVTATSGFCTNYCGWHTNGLIKGQDIKFSFIGNPATKCPQNCSAQNLGPNGDLGADAAASILVHELEETITDPDLNAWYDKAGNENADKCAWTFGPTYTTANGAKANVNLGGRDYLIQQNWINANGGFCAMSFSNTAPSLTSIAPNSGSAGTTVNVTLTGTNFVSGATVAVSGLGVTASNVAVPSATQITASLTIAAGSAGGARNVTVTTPSGTSGSAAFTVIPSAPTLTSMNPASGSAGTTVAVTLTGTNFTPAAGVRLSGVGAAVRNVVVVSSTQITVNFVFASTTATGVHNVYVVTSAGNSAILPFTVK